jgi:Spy/CpxP family protein refolding chaperone
MKTLLTLAATLAFFVIMPAYAQQDDAQTRQETGMMGENMEAQGMMQGMQACMMMMQSMHSGMMNGMPGARMMQDGEMGDRMTSMMQQPMHRAAMLVHILPTMQEPLNLDEGQVDRLKSLHQNLMASHADFAERVRDAQSALNDLLAEEDPDASRVESLLKSAAETRAEMQASMIAASLKMKDVLSTEQRAILAEMKPADMHRHMMQNMSMMEMMQMMQMMQMMNGMRGGMMTNGMMDGAMMNQNMRQGGMMDNGPMQRGDTARGQHEQHHR